MEDIFSSEREETAHTIARARVAATAASAAAVYGEGVLKRMQNTTLFLEELYSFSDLLFKKMMCSSSVSNYAAR